MSRANAAHSIPPGDRDELPFVVPAVSSEAPVVGRDTETQPGGAGLESSPEMPMERTVLLPGLTLVIDESEHALEAAQIALAELKMARKQGNVALFKAAAHRFASLANHAHRTAKAYQPRETEVQTTTKE